MSVSATTTSTTTTTQSSSSVDRSGLTEDEAVTAKLQPYLDRIDTIDTQISGNTTKITAYQQMQSLLQSLESAADILSNPTDGTINVFQDLSASLSSSSSTAASTLMSADIATGTATGSHEITITQLAQAERLGSTSQTSETAALSLSGSFTIGESGKTAATISITSSMSLSDIATAINNQTSTTGVTASVITVSNTASNPQYMLVLTGGDTDQTIAMSETSGSVLSDLGVTGSDGSTAADVLTAAQPAILNIDGIDGIERSTNTISDILDGVTLHLTKADASTTITMDISADTSSIETAIAALVTAYNNWRSFVNTNQATQSDGTAGTAAVLFSDSTLRGTSLQIDTALNEFVNSLSLSAIGISLDSSNNLTVDTTTLDDAVTNNLSQVQSLFEYQATTSSTDLTLANHLNASYTGSFTLDISTDGSGNITGVSGEDSSGNAVNFTYSGSKISGVSGSVYAGLTFTFTGTTSETITVNASQGVAAQLYQVNKAAANTTDGTVQTVITNLQDLDTNLTQRVSDLTTSEESYRTFLLNQYGLLEASISSANQTVSLLQELMSSSSSSG